MQIVAAPQILLTPETKEVVAYVVCGGTWVNMTTRIVSSTGVDGRTPGNVLNTVSIEHAPYPVLIGIVATSPPCGIRGIL